MSKLAAALNVRRKKKMAAGGMMEGAESLPENQGPRALSPRERLSQIDQAVEQSDPAHQEEESRHIPDKYADGGTVKPKLQPIKEPSMVRSTGPFKVKSMAEAREEEMQRALADHERRMAEGGEVDFGPNEHAKGVHAPRERNSGESTTGMDAKAKTPSGNEFAKKKHKEMLGELRSMPKPKLAEGGMIDDMDQPEAEEDMERASSVAAAIMAKRRMMAEGGEVDLESNAKEDMHVAQDLNLDAGLKENYSESDMLDMDQPEDSNEHGDSIETDRHDMIAAIRRKMSKSPMVR